MDPKLLPVVHTLEHAVQAVIDQNKSIGYPPNRFSSKLNSAPNKILACLDLMKTPQAQTAIYDAIKRMSHRDLLTIDDFIAVYGKDLF